MDKWKGCVVEESLTDNRVLSGFDIIDLNITKEANPAERWHIYTLLATEKDIALLQSYLKSKWYMHFWQKDRMKAVFRDKSFDMTGDSRTWRDAIEYGISMGIPREQLDFKFTVGTADS